MGLRLQLGVLRISELGTFAASLKPLFTGRDETSTSTRCNQGSKEEVAGISRYDQSYPQVYGRKLRSWQPSKRGSVLSPPFRSPQPDSAHREYDWDEAQGGDVIQQWSQLVIWQDYPTR